jgi:hypothetical protein
MTSAHSPQFHTLRRVSYNFISWMKRVVKTSAKHNLVTDIHQDWPHHIAHCIQNVLLMFC